jgi:hypothetical protein
MTLPPNDHWFRRLIEQQRQIEKLLNPISESMNVYQRIIDSTKLPALGYQNATLQNIHISDYLSLSGFSENYLSLQKQIENSLGSIDSMSRELEDIRNSVGFDSILEAQENLYKLQDQFLPKIGMFEPPSVRIESVLAAAEATLRLWNPQSFFTDFTLTSVAEYQAFINRQFKWLQYDKDIIAEHRIEITELSGDLFEVINTSLTIGEALERQGGECQSEEIIHDETFKSGIYGQVNQHLGFVYSDRFTGKIEKRFNKAIPVRISHLGYSITEQVFRINSLCESKGETPVFKPTSKTMRACSTIPSLIVSNETEFYLLIDYLFFLLYEGSGTAIRLISITNESLLDPLWKVKHLRLAARHDINHGSNREIEKKRAKIRDIYFSLIAKPLPTKQGDWQKAQLQIYIEIDLMLQKVIEEFMEGIKKG